MRLIVNGMTHFTVHSQIEEQKQDQERNKDGDISIVNSDIFDISMCPV